MRDYVLQVLGLSNQASLIWVGNEPPKRVTEKISMHFVAETERNGIPYWHYAVATDADT